MTRPTEPRSFAPKALILTPEDYALLQAVEARVCAAYAAGVGVEEAEMAREAVRESLAQRMGEGP